MQGFFPRGRLVDLPDMVGLVDGESSAIGKFDWVGGEALPEWASQQLNHNHHMTVTVESFYGCSVDVEVLQAKTIDNVYIREILLRRSTDKVVVQYGIVRLQLSTLEAAPRNAILSEKIPLGRVLIEHDVMRHVELVDLWQITVGPLLSHYFEVPVGTITFGRTAMIYFNAKPALELVEIIRPVSRKDGEFLIG